MESYGCFQFDGRDSSDFQGNLPSPHIQLDSGARHGESLPQDQFCGGRQVVKFFQAIVETSIPEWLSIIIAVQKKKLEGIDYSAVTAIRLHAWRALNGVSGKRSGQLQ
jgi:hypothetical protein